MKNFLPLLIIVIVFLGCQNQSQEISGGRQTYFDLDSLVGAQITLLVAEQAALTKNAMLNGDKDSTQLIPDSLGWSQELNLVRAANFNKPVLWGLYEVETSRNEPGHNLSVRTYTGPEGAATPWLKLYYLDDLEHLKKIEGINIHNNELLKSTRSFEVDFEDFGGKPRITQYQIKGAQKMIMQDSVNFIINGHINRVP